MWLSTIILATAIILSAARGEGDASSVDRGAFLRTPQTPSRYQGAGNCSEPCDEALEFCGTDHTCHVYSCADWYQWGPPEYTGHVLGVPVEIFLNETMILTEGNAEDLPALECKDVTESVYAPSVIYGCSRWICTGNNCQGYAASVYPDEGLGQDFSQQCSTNIGNLEFVCHDNHRDDSTTAQLRSSQGPTTQADIWESFLTAVEQSAVNCSNEYVPSPEFLYSIYVAWPFQGVSTGSRTPTFNQTHAAATIHSSLDIVDAGGSSAFGFSCHLTWALLLAGLLWSANSSM